MSDPTRHFSKSELRAVAAIYEQTCKEYVAEIEMLRAAVGAAATENKRLRAALGEIEMRSQGWQRGTSAEINKIAKEALGDN